MIKLRPRLGTQDRKVRIAVSPSELVAMRAGRADLIRFALPGTTEITAWADAIRASLTEIAETVQEKDRSLHVLLLPPLVEVKIACLPRLRATERRAVLVRDAERYFALNGRPVVADAVPSTRSSRGDVLRPHILVAVPEQIVSALADSAKDAGFSLEAISVSTLCLGAAANARAGSSRSAILACTYDDRVELTAATDGKITAIRRIPLGRDLDAVIDSITRLMAERTAESQRPDVLVIGGLERPFVPINGDIGNCEELGELVRHSDPAAACVSQRDRGPSVELLPPALRSRRQRAGWRQSARSLGAGLCLLILASGLRVYRIRHELQQERERRAVLSTQVSQALRIVDTLASLQKEWLVIERGDSRGWDRMLALASLARALPSEATLLSIRLRDDTLFIAGIAANAEKVLAALQDTPDFAGSRFTSPVEQVVQSDDAVTERFAIRSTLSNHRRTLANERPLRRGSEEP
jgi:hypothetical protein